jgi:hypothetical protein
MTKPQLYDNLNELIPNFRVALDVELKRLVNSGALISWKDR